MWFFGLTKAIEDTVPKNPAEPKRRSILGTLFNPDIGASLRPLGETTSVFVQLIAMVFAMNGLFPKNHPALQNVGGARLTFSEIFSTAWNDLSFTKQGLPKVILFIAVTGTMIFAVLSMVTALLAGFMGTAHADTGSSSTGFFSPASNDLAQNFLNYIFKAQPLSNYLAQNGKEIVQTINIQCGLMSALGFYSNAMLIFAAVILFYHLVSMVVMTAHEGVAMGKRANQVWAPIRLVFAIGLLVPVGTGASSNCGASGSGLNAGQYIVIQMASWGSGMASQTWAAFLNGMTTADNNNNYIQPSTPIVADVTRNIVMMEACKFAWNYRICVVNAATTPGGDPAQCASPNTSAASQNFTNEMIPTPTPTWTDSTTGDIHYEYSPKNMINKDNICGEIIIPAFASANAQIGVSMSTTSSTGVVSGMDSSSVAKALQQAQNTTVQSLIGGQFSTVGATIKNVIPGLNDGPIPTNADYIALANTYQTQLQQNLSSALKSTGLNQSQVSTISSLGWAGAGAWVNTISHDQGAVIDAYENGLPKTIGPDVGDLGSVNGHEVARWLSHFSKWIDHQDPTQAVTTGCLDQAVAAAGGGSATGGGSSPGTGTDPSGIGNTALNTAQSAINSGNVSLGGALQEIRKLKTLMGKPVDSKFDVGKDITIGIFSLINAQAARSGVWNDTSTACPSTPGAFTLGAQLVTANPLQEFSFWGHANLRAAFSLWQDIADLSVASAIDQQLKEVDEFQFRDAPNKRNDIIGEGLSSRVYDFAAGILGLFATIFMTAGFTVAFVVPLMPYFRFFFSVLTWIVSTLEAIVAIPLVALAHLNPEGEGLPGQSAKAGYFMIFNIFVRPVLTVFGLIAGLLVFYIAIMLLNMTFAIAVAGTNAMGHSYETIVRIAFTVTYAAAVYTCANNAFKTIGMFPEYALRWMGQQAHHERMGDGGRAIQGALGQAQGVLGDKALGVIRLKS